MKFGYQNQWKAKMMKKKRMKNNWPMKTLEMKFNLFLLKSLEIAPISNSALNNRKF